MNPRIKELANKAYGITDAKPFHPSALVALEAFAELIVRECGVALSPMLRDMVSRGQAYDLIKQHFGVEE